MCRASQCCCNIFCRVVEEEKIKLYLNLEQIERRKTQTDSSQRHRGFAGATLGQSHVSLDVLLNDVSALLINYFSYLRSIGVHNRPLDSLNSYATEWEYLFQYSHRSRSGYCSCGTSFYLTCSCPASALLMWCKYYWCDVNNNLSRLWKACVASR